MKNQLLVICLALVCFGLGFGVRGVVQPQAQAISSLSQMELVQYQDEELRTAYLHGYGLGQQAAAKGEPLDIHGKYDDPWSSKEENQAIWKGAQAGFLEASH